MFGREITIKPVFKIDAFVLGGVTVLLLGAMVFMVLRLLDQSESHVNAVKDMKVEFVGTQFQPDISDTTDRIQSDLKTDPNRTWAKYRNLMLNEKSFKAISKMHKLTGLELCDCEYDPKLLRYLTKLPALVFLDVSGSDLVDEDLKVLGDIKTLNTVKLSDTKCSGKSFAYFKDSKNLQLIEVNGLMVTDEDLKALEGLPLDNLNVSGTQITNAGCDSISKLVTLTKLDIGRTKIDGVGLARLKPLVNLMDLSLNECHLTDADLQVCAQFPKMIKLHFRESPITDNGLMVFARSKTLTHIYVVNCPKVTKEGIAKLRLANPKIYVELGTEATGFSRYKDFMPE